MRNFPRYFMVLSTLWLAGCAAQQGADSAQPTASASTVVAVEAAENSAENSSSSADPDELICRREVVTGTNFRRRVCMTRAERAQEQADSQEEMLERRSAVR